MEEKKGFFNEYKDQIKDALNDIKTKGKRHKQIPNILTLLRLTAPLVILPAALIGNVPFIIGATAAFGLTDLADGFIARHWNLTSKLGADLDALADKLFAGTLLLAASITNPALLVNVGLEMAIAGININQKAKGKEAASTLMGKIKTFALFPLAGAGILSASIAPSILAGLAITTTALQAMTIKSYLKKYNDEKPKAQIKPVEIKNDKPDIVEPKLEQTKDLVKILDPKTTGQNIATENPKVKELREMREFLLREKVLRKPVVSEEPKVYRKK